MACSDCEQNRTPVDYTSSCKVFNMNKRVIQFNDVVLDGISSFSYGSGFKFATTSYTAADGDYYVNKNGRIYTQAISLDIDMSFPFSQVKKKDVRYYRNFLIEQLSKPGKLWFVEANTLYWAYAIPRDWNRDFDARVHEKLLTTSIQFMIPAGVLYEADPYRTFIQHYNLCDFLMDTSTDVGGICTCNNFMSEPCPACMECEVLEEENTLCYNLNQLDELFKKQCANPYKIIYNCEKAKEVFDCEHLWGDKFCFCECGGILYEQIYSTTTIPSSDITIRLVGHFKNPEITLNNTRITIQGEYHGTIKIKDSTDFTYRAACYDCECENNCDECQIDCDIWDETIPPLYPDCETGDDSCGPCVPAINIDFKEIEFETCSGQLFEIQHGQNKLRVRGDIATEDQCSQVFVEHQRKTI